MPDGFLLSKHISSAGHGRHRANSFHLGTASSQRPGAHAVVTMGSSCCPRKHGMDVPLCRRGQSHQAPSHRVSWVGP